MICVMCGRSVSDVYKEYSKGNIRLSRCVRAPHTGPRLAGFVARAAQHASHAFQWSRHGHGAESFLCGICFEQDHCHSVADKYVELELVLIVIDLVLHNASVYRHILFNRLEYTERGIPVRCSS